MACFDFHHPDPTHKDPSFAYLTDMSDAKAIEAVGDCDLLCANCHRIRHMKE